METAAHISGIAHVAVANISHDNDDARSMVPTYTVVVNR